MSALRLIDRASNLILTENGHFAYRGQNNRPATAISDILKSLGKKVGNKERG